MIHQTLHFSVLISLIGISCSSDVVQVISGVFMPNNNSVSYDGAKAVCAIHNSRLATLENITFAFINGYESCRWGWIEEKRLVMLRRTPFHSCADYKVGILMRDCPTIKFTFCVNSTSGTVYELPIPTSHVTSYENASNTCTENGFTIATKGQIEKNTSYITDNRLAWYNWGIGRMNNGSLQQDFCYMLSNASAFCYNTALPDVLISKSTSTWKIIAMGCIIGFTFVILLLAATFMRGNNFVCCMKDTQSPAAAISPAPVPTWNTTNIYQRINEMNRTSVDDKVIKRPPVIQPEMNFYKTHYSNMAFDRTGEMI